MDTIISSPFSLVRFEHPSDDGVSLDIPYSLPAFGHYDVAFQFIVSTERDPASPIKLGIADRDGELLNDLSSAYHATILSYRYRIYSLNNYNSLKLFSIEINGVVKNYGKVLLTKQQFIDTLFDDYSIVVTDDYFVLPNNVLVHITAYDAGSGTTELFPEDIIAKWHAGYVNISEVPLSESCFTYALLEADNSVIAHSNSFQQVDEAFYTSVITYSCNEDAFGFNYPSGIVNRVRIPVYLKSPQLPATRKVYKRSDGVNRLTSATVEKTYNLETEQMPEVFHESLRIAFLHDSVTMENSNIREKTVTVVESDNYDIAWSTDDNGDYPFAKATSKLKVATFGYSNSNC